MLFNLYSGNCLLYSGSHGGDTFPSKSPSRLHLTGYQALLDSMVAHTTMLSTLLVDYHGSLQLCYAFLQMHRLEQDEMDRPLCRSSTGIRSNLISSPLRKISGAALTLHSTPPTRDAPVLPGSTHCCREQYGRPEGERRQCQWSRDQASKNPCRQREELCRRAPIQDLCAFSSMRLQHQD
jgi:hypothetical protein